MNIKYFVIKFLEYLLKIRYKILVFTGFGFEMQYRYFPEHLIKKRVFKIKTQDIKWAYDTKPLSAAGLLIKGDWDIQSKIPIEKFLKTNDSCHTVYQIYDEGLPFQESDQYKTIKEYVSSGIVGPGWQARGCYTIKEIDQYFELLHKSFQNILKNGYKSQKELGRTDVYDELAIAIDRNGEFQKQGGEGHHRLAIAFLLEVPDVPVIIHKIHYNWAKQQFDIYKLDLLRSLTKAVENLAV